MGGAALDARGKSICILLRAQCPGGRRRWHVTKHATRTGDRVWIGVDM